MKSKCNSERSVLRFMENRFGSYVNPHAVEYSLNLDHSIFITCCLPGTIETQCTLFKNCSTITTLWRLIHEYANSDLDLITPQLCWDWYRKGNMTLFCEPDSPGGPALIFSIQNNIYFATDWDNEITHEVRSRLVLPSDYINYSKKYHFEKDFKEKVLFETT